MASTFSKMAHKVGDKIDEYAEKNKQSKQSSNTDNATYNSPYSTNAGPHNSNALNKVDPRVDSDRDGRNDPTSRVGGYGTSQHTAGGLGGDGSTNTGYGSSHTGIHNTGLHTGTHNASSGYSNTANTSHANPQSINAGPHNSSMMNKLDPRVDSDRDGRNNLSSHTGGYGHTQTGYGSNGGSHTGIGHHDTSTASYGGAQSTTAGPHNSNLLNKLDPRVDSDMDGRNNHTSHTGGYGQTQGNYGSGVSHTGTTQAHHATTGHGHVNTTGASYDNPQSTTAGPHKSNLLNKLDPRVDSDRDGRNDPTSRAGGYGQTQTGYGSNSGPGYGTTTTTTHHPTVVTQTTQGGHYGSNQGQTGINTGYDHPQSTNAGPHKNNLMNKLDPRVDSDRDGRNDPSSRVGGYGNTQTGGAKYY